MSMKIILTVLCTGLLTGSLSVCASGQPRGRMSFENLDTNNDGKIALQEFIDMAQARRRSPEDIFKRLDADGDGFINQEEFAARPAGRGGRR